MMVPVTSLDTVATVVLQSSDDDGMLWTLIALALGFLGGLYAIYWGFRKWKLSRLIEDTPTENVRSIAAGRTELEGVVREHDGTIDPPFVEEPSVYVDWQVERRERYRDEDGNIERRWETVASGTSARPFAIEDDTGRAVVRLDRDDPTVDINEETNRLQTSYERGEEAPENVLQFLARDDEPEEDDGGNDGVFDSVADTVSDAFDSVSEPLTDTDHRRRYHQEVLPVGSDVYFLGGAEPRSDGSMSAGQQDLLELRRHDGSDVFLVSDGKEEQLHESYGRWALAGIAGGLILSAVCLWLLLTGLALV